jgi:hypothetical protein
MLTCQPHDEFLPTNDQGTAQPAGPSVRSRPQELMSAQQLLHSTNITHAGATAHMLFATQIFDLRRCTCLSVKRTSSGRIAVLSSAAAAPAAPPDSAAFASSSHCRNNCTAACHPWLLLLLLAACALLPAATAASCSGFLQSLPTPFHVQPLLT